jgi:hypothetical protein
MAAARAIPGEIQIASAAFFLTGGALLGLGARIGAFGGLLQKWVLRNGLVQFLHTLQGRQLQQFHGLLQSRCEGELLLQAQSHDGIGHS